MEGLSLEQRDAVKHVLSTRDQCCGVRGVAGSGKTTLQREVLRGLKEAGHRVIAIAPTASAAKTLQGEGFNDATTVAGFLQNGAAQGDLLHAVVICDEAGLQSNRLGEALLRMAQKHQMRVIFVGDVQQHVSVEAGDFLRVLETHSKLSRCAVMDIQRQKHAAYKEAVGLLSSGATRVGLAALDELGWVHESQANYLKEAAATYFQSTDDGKNLDNCLAVSPTWEENRHLTLEIRMGLKKRGLLPDVETPLTVYDSLRWTVQQRGNWRNYQPGQVVIFTQSAQGWKAGESAQVARIEKGHVVLVVADRERVLSMKSAPLFDVAREHSVGVSPGDKILIRANAKSAKLINGQVLTVKNIHPDGSLDTQESLTIPVRFKQWTHGYVVTSHKAQGRTCNRVVVAAARLDAKSAYVACSRGREFCSVHTPDKEALMAHLPEGHRRAALDVLQSARPNDPYAQIRTTAYQKISEEIQRARLFVRKRTEQVALMVMRYQAQMKRVYGPTQSQRPQNLRPGIGL